MAGKRQLNYIKPAEPSFLAKFKKDSGYKEGPTVDTKKGALSLDDLPDRPDEEDEKPVVVVLGKGDLTQEEAEEEGIQINESQKEKEEEEDDDEPSDGRIRFRKPTKRSQVDTSDLKASSSKKKKDDKKKKDKSRSGKKVKNSSLLSFGEDEEEEDT
eukprot:XP_003730239.2 PREDICTED: uncharacterized protein KIAA1143 homolog [Strongylocentrotus purpuratus]